MKIMKIETDQSTHMNKTHLLLITGLLVATTTIEICGQDPSRANNATRESLRRPNIVFLLADDQRFDALGCMGNKIIKTPHLDRLAADGVLFQNHYNTSPICMASRASIMTGLHEFRHGCNFHIGSLGREAFELSYPVLLRKAGYRTAFAGKFGFPITPQQTTHADVPGVLSTFDAPLRNLKEAEGYLPRDQFDDWAGWPGQGFHQTARNKPFSATLGAYAEKYPGTSRAMGAWACDVIKDFVKQGKPFCLSLSFKAPHDPPEPDPLDLELYKGVTFPKPANWGEAGAKHLPPQPKLSRMYLTDEGTRWTSEESYQGYMRLYYQLINGNDVALGMIREELERQGVAGNTIIIYTSDNGYSCGAHAIGGKVFPYEESARAPLIIYDPRIPPQDRKPSCAALTGNIDMAPTILDYAGVPAPESMDGRSLAPLLRDPRQKVRDTLGLVNAWPWSRESLVLSLVTPEWKYIYWFYGDQRMEPAEELYDMRHDRLEMANLAKDPRYSKMLGEMRARYDNFRARALSSCNRANPHYRQYLEWADRHTPWSGKKWIEVTVPERGKSNPK